MIAGQVTANRQALIPLEVYGPSGQKEDVSAIVDTGFTEALTLSSTTIGNLALTYQYDTVMVLGDGNSVQMSAYKGTVIWDGQPQTVLVYESDATLVGMSLLYGFKLKQ
ncbi:MAG TPA: hypothetical protein VFB38_02510 [Chthonomonadaceae bacterium]|nr:hypothetical protein [Chthonomonadaceae bacterium]